MRSERVPTAFGTRSERDRSVRLFLSSTVNGLPFPENPSCFDLNELECRFLAPRLAFQKSMQVPRGRQLKINGNIVVPADVVNTVNILPGFSNDTSTVNLKRRLQHKSSALSQNVRPNKVTEAAK
jgi:hypothetical protein